MKMKYLAAATLALGSTASFAACPAFDSADPATWANSCVPEEVMFVAGSSALGNAIKSVVGPDLFDTTTQPVTAVVDGGPQGAFVSAWYGMSKAAVTGGASKRLLVIYNNNNGSAAGVSMLLGDGVKGNAPEADVVTVGHAGGCANNAASTAAAPKVNCTTHKLQQATLAISDVRAEELYKLSSWLTKPNKLSTIKQTVLGMQGFGIAVNNAFYQALQTAQIANGSLPATCTAGDATDACRPSIRRADYASLVSKTGAIKSADGFIAGDTMVLTLARRDDQSGTQATSNLFFANNACGVQDKKGTTLGGALAIVGAADSTSALVVHENATTGAVKADLNAATGYAIGMLGLNAIPGAADTWKFVKLDGVSPIGADTAKQRAQFASGDYPLAVASVAVEYAKADAKTHRDTLNHALIAGLRDSSLHNLAGIGYLDGVVAAQQSKVHRGLGLDGKIGNNCSPLVK